MNLDLSSILRDWPFKPGEVNVRRIIGEDGQEKIQLRLDLGILQMETTGRPDGRRPYGYESLLDYYLAQLQEYIDEFGSDDGFELSDEACEMLRAEGVMYYHRYLAVFVLGDFDAVSADASRNLKLFDFCAAYAADEQDRLILEQYRPYVLMMYTRAQARIALKNNRPRQALVLIRKGIKTIQEVYRRFGRDAMAGSSTELAVLNALAHEIKDQVPVDPKAILEQELEKAIADERYEKAAEIRDRLQALNDTSHHSHS